MARISITDSLNTDIVSSNPQVNSGFGRYLRGDAAALLAGADVVSQLRMPLGLANAGESGLRLAWATDLPLGGDGVALSVEAGASATIGVYNRTGMVLLDGTFLGPAVKVPAGRAFVSFALRPSLALGLEHQAGALSFGFSAGTEAELQCYLPFDLDAAPPTLAAATAQVLDHFVIPNTVGDLERMRDLPAGTLACVSGHGQLRVGASVNLAAAFNPLASVDTIPRLGRLEVLGGASAVVGVKATLFGDFQIRAQKIDGAVVRLSLHTVAGRTLDVSLDAAAGAGISLGDRDLIALLFRAPGGIPGASREDLVEGGISAEQLDRVAQAMKAAISRKLEVSISGELSSLTRDEAAFMYEIDLDGLDAAGVAAVDRALAGDFTAINALEDETAEHGVRVVRSASQTLKQKQVRWRINLVGIVNLLSMRELVRIGTVVHDRESGELVVTDKITSDRVGATIGPRQLRKLLYESTLMTMTYKASGLDVNDLEAAQSFFFFDHDANRQRMSDYLDAVIALGLMAPDSPSARLTDDDYGKASLQIETAYDRAACERAFGIPGAAPSQDDYEAIGRHALLALVKPDDPDAYRRIPLSNPALWQTLKDAAPPNFHLVLPPPITGNARSALRVGVVVADFTLITWWAAAMALAANRLGQMRDFLTRHPGADLDADPEFRKRRAELEKAMVKAIRRNTSSFDDPWGLVALFLASHATAAATATVVSSKLTAFLPEAADEPPASERSLPSFAAVPRAVRAPAPEVELPPADVALLRRHAVNLRMGAFSSGGLFQTTREDVEALFADHLPRFLADLRQRDPNARLKLVFFAHGGLNDELESLKNAVNRIPFYLANQCYPVFFVWETGPKETLRDIVGQIFGFGTGRGLGDTVSSFTDPVLEAQFRNVGVSMWTNMKLAAERAFLPKQGGTFVIEQLAAFWKQHSAEMEVHGIGHSAGAIFQAHFVSTLCQQPSNPPITIESLHLLAPAITVQLFKDTLKDLVGGRIKALTEYTMARDFELADRVGPYRKSLLYLVSRAFEDAPDTLILGLEESLRRDPEMRDFFGLLNKRRRQADVLFSVTEEGAAHSTIARKHGDFDNDRLTMGSVMRRILGVGDQASIVDFPETVAVTVLDGPGAAAAAAVAAPIEFAPAPAAVGMRAPVSRGAVLPGPSSEIAHILARLDAIDRRLSGLER
jgi:hypothetical protein